MDHDDENKIINIPGYDSNREPVFDQTADTGPDSSSGPASDLDPGLGLSSSFDSNGPSGSPPAPTGKNRWIDFKFNTLSAVIGAVIASVLFLFLSNIFTIPERVEKLDEAVGDIRTNELPGLKTELEGDISGVQTNLNNAIQGVKDDIRATNDNVAGLGQRIDSLVSLFMGDLRLKPTEEYVEQIVSGLGQKASFDLDSGPIFLTAVAYSASGTEYTTNQLAELKLLLPYEDDGAEGVFYGSFSENNRWDGNCIVNLYKDGKLVLITDAVYDDGKVLSCKQAFPDVTTGERLDDGTVLKQDIWVVSDRVIENGVSRGETWHYFRDGDFKQQFDADEVTFEDIISVDDFEIGLSRFYSPNLSDMP